MDFFLRLSEEDVIELINKCFDSDKEKGGWPNFSVDHADQALIYAEEDRVDERGRRYAWVRGINNQKSMPKYLASFRITDFNMCYGDNLPHSYDNVLRAFMALKFGEEYVLALHAFHVSEADLESKFLREYLTVTKQDNQTR